MSHGIARNPIHSRRGIDLLDTIRAAQVLRRYLARRGLLVLVHRSEGEDTARADTKHTADDALFPHTDADQRMFIAVLLEELHHEHVVVKRSRRGDNLLKIAGDA